MITDIKAFSLASKFPTDTLSVFITGMCLAHLLILLSELHKYQNQIITQSQIQQRRENSHCAYDDLVNIGQDQHFGPLLL